MMCNRCIAISDRTLDLIKSQGHYIRLAPENKKKDIFSILKISKTKKGPWKQVVRPAVIPEKKYQKLQANQVKFKESFFMLRDGDILDIA